MSLTFLLTLVTTATLVLICAFLTQRFQPYYTPKCATDKQHRHNSANLIPPNPEVLQPPSASPLHIYEQAAVCSDSNICSEIGKNTLLGNGSAVDAAIATLLCNGLLAMQSMGLGGGLLMNVYISSEQRAYSVLSRELAPKVATAAMFQKLQNMSETFQSSLSIAIPTEILGYAAAHERFGRIPWARLVQPTVEICHAGYELSKHQRDALLINKQRIREDYHLRRMFVDPETADFYRVGTQIKPPKELCRTLKRLAVAGGQDFYAGELAASVAADLKDLGSLVDEIDLRSVNADVVPSVVFPLGEYDLHLVPPPGSGHIVGFIMNILHNFRREGKGYFSKELESLEVHLIAEAFKFGFVKRWELDMQLDQELLTNLTCPQYAKELAILIDDFRTHNKPHYYGASSTLTSRTEHGTAHISVLAPNGDAVSVTSSVNFYFGSARTGTRSGILFNNAMSDFAIEGVQNYFDLPNVPERNRIKPYTSPMSSMAPTIVTERATGEVRLVLGAAGGTKIISVLVQLLVRMLWLKQDIKQATDAARFHHQLLPNFLEYEYGTLRQIVESLEDRGHETKRYRERSTAVCGIERSGDAIFANADYRMISGVAGF